MPFGSINSIIIVINCLFFFACAPQNGKSGPTGPPGQKGSRGIEGPVGPRGTMGSDGADGGQLLPGEIGLGKEHGMQGASSGGGHRVDENSKPLLEFTRDYLGSQIRLSSRRIYENLPQGWTREKLAETIERIEEQDKPTGRSTKQLLFDYTFDDGSGEGRVVATPNYFLAFSQFPFLSILRRAEAKGTPVRFDDSQAAQIESLLISMLHEVGHLVFSHHKQIGERSDNEFDTEARNFAFKVLNAIQADGILCKSKSPVFNWMGRGFDEEDYQSFQQGSYETMVYLNLNFHQNEFSILTLEEMQRNYQVWLEDYSGKGPFDPDSFQLESFSSVCGEPSGALFLSWEESCSGLGPLQRIFSDNTPHSNRHIHNTIVQTDQINGFSKGIKFNVFGSTTNDPREGLSEDWVKIDEEGNGDFKVGAPWRYVDANRSYSIKLEANEEGSIVGAVVEYGVKGNSEIRKGWATFLTIENRNSPTQFDLIEIRQESDDVLLDVNQTEKKGEFEMSCTELGQPIEF